MINSIDKEIIITKLTHKNKENFRELIKSLKINRKKIISKLIKDERNNKFKK